MSNKISVVFFILLYIAQWRH